MQAADPDIELARLAQAGDARAFEALVVKYQRRIARHVARFIKSADDVEDVVQDVFVRAYRGLASFRGDSQFYSWLYRIASNAALNHLRQASDDVLLGDDAPDERISEFAPGVSDAAQPDRTLMAEQIADAVPRARIHSQTSGAGSRPASRSQVVAMSLKVSQLLDGQLSTQETQSVLAELAANPAERDRFTVY